MRRVPPTASGIMTPLTSIGNTKASSVSHPCVMCNGCGKPPWPKLPNEKDENPPPDTCAPFSSCSELETLSQFDMTDAQRKHRWRKEGHASIWLRSEEHTSELQSLTNLVCRLLLEKKNKKKK